MIRRHAAGKKRGSGLVDPNRGPKLITFLTTYLISMNYVVKFHGEIRVRKQNHSGYVVYKAFVDDYEDWPIGVDRTITCRKSFQILDSSIPGFLQWNEEASWIAANLIIDELKRRQLLPRYLIKEDIYKEADILYL